MTQQDEFEAKALAVVEVWRANRHGDNHVLHELIAEALRAEHLRGDAAGYIRGQIGGLYFARALYFAFGGCSPIVEQIDDRIAELRKVDTGDADA
jgi:hypothetical protein